MARWGTRCAYCDAPAEHLDHIKPIAKGGTDVLRNVLPACAPCNTSKGTLTLAQWAATFGAREKESVTV
ncbi:HNH endonuclease [Streptomyces sp. SDr-06]|uniref:HNH endonuclease n=1 Tax=Streptomyces sp. SDr-06 TaxID=2267702 RepID=UPI000DEB41B5|nr:HNH endonuclease [Streptomyces sp. SDr-06]